MTFYEGGGMGEEAKSNIHSLISLFSYANITTSLNLL